MPSYGLQATEQQQAQLFEGVRERYALASARVGEIVRDYRVAGTSVRLRFAGEALMPTILPALAHPVADAAGEPDHEIRIWDSESTGTRNAPPPRHWDDFTGRGNIWGLESQRYRSAYLWGEGSVNLLDRATRQAIYWVPSHQFLPAWVLAAPLRHILHWCMEISGRQLVHGAAVGHGGRGMLLPGRSGSGKSSTSLACLAAGLEFISDDYLALALDPEPRVYRLYSSAKLYPHSLALHPELKERCRHVYVPEFDKVILFLEEGYGGQLRESLPLKLVLRPFLSGRPETTIGPLAPLEIERALEAETLVQLPHVGSQTVDFLERASRQVPHGALHLGTDRPAIVSAIREALVSAPQSAPPAAAVAGLAPFVSVIVYYRKEDRQELRALAADLAGQSYPRVELVVAADGPARAMEDESTKLPGNVRFLPFDQPVARAVAWNRAIREAFAELLIFVDPGDRLAPGALEALVDAARRGSDAAVIRSVDDAGGDLRGALIRKSAFRKFGLFNPDVSAEGRECEEWLANRPIEVHIDRPTLHATRPPTAPGAPLLRQAYLRIREARRGGALE
jgi:hypothetical protein